jgi:hypothetical protein
VQTPAPASDVEAVLSRRRWPCRVSQHPNIVSRRHGSQLWRSPDLRDGHIRLGPVAIADRGLRCTPLIRHWSEDVAYLANGSRSSPTSTSDWSPAPSAPSRFEWWAKPKSVCPPCAPEPRRPSSHAHDAPGAVPHAVDAWAWRHLRNEKVRGSNPLSSTKYNKALTRRNASAAAYATCTRDVACAPGVLDLALLLAPAACLRRSRGNSDRPPIAVAIGGWQAQAIDATP